MPYQEKGQPLRKGEITMKELSVAQERDSEKTITAQGFLDDNNAQINICVCGILGKKN